MRDQKFRGRQKYAAKGWLKGDKTTINGEAFIWPEDDSVDSPDNYQVDPATVGAETGMPDKKGDPIWEGDTLGDLCEVDGEMVMSELPVVWWEEKGMWAVDISYTKNGSALDPLHEWNKELEITGNIHEK